jgi:hypothetical protein
MRVLCFGMQGENVIEHTNGKCYLCTLWSICRPLWNIGIHLITLLNILVSRYQQAHLNVKSQEAILMVKLLVIVYPSIRLKNRISDTITHVTLLRM